MQNIGTITSERVKIISDVLTRNADANLHLDILNLGTDGSSSDIG